MLVAAKGNRFEPGGSAVMGQAVATLLEAAVILASHNAPMALLYRPCLAASLIVLPLLVAACATSSGGGTAGTSASGSGSPSAVAAPAFSAVNEQRRLADALRGTPVVVESPTSGQLRVQVPLEFCFDAGRSAVKRPLGAVLDKMAPGLRQPASFDVRVAAPTDARGAGGASLAQDRAASTRDYLVARGVAATRFVALGRAGSDAVEVLVSEKSGLPKLPAPAPQP